MLKNYFRLFEECYLVNGINGGAIYNLLTGYIYKLSINELNILSLLEQNYSILELLNQNELKKINIENFLNTIKDNGLGNYYDKKTYIEKLSKDPEWKRFVFFTPPPFLNRAFIELENQCDSNCKFCNANKYIRRSICLGCNKWPIKENILDVDSVLNLLEKLKKLNCQDIYFTGGDIFINWTRTKTILNKSKKLDFNSINIIWGGNYLSNEILATLKELNISLIIQKYIAKNYDINNDILINQLKKIDLNFSFLLLFDFNNTEQVENVVNKINSLVKCKLILIDFLLDINNTLNVEKYKKNINLIPLVKINDFFTKRSHHPCIVGTIAITGDGYIIPCPGLREYKIGHVNNFLNVFKAKKINKFWDLSKEKINGCNNCEFRYACNDCRYVEIKLGSKLLSMSSCDLNKKILNT
ncbi:SPASM domain-containing protein [Clostridium tyrobutyricum]|uniref:radical SAM/SPASM domain-containing protein n=1 Tax=Clostridium tyrobutyricum TaxID=1519 RepID=UPI001C38661E|nr:radical SAM protein [Clostridium tyrobutyricum]MBV4431672.1 SPASM domain-containing protein [Clostridium tyrobutyricum]